MTLHWQKKEITKWNTPLIIFKVTKHTGSNKKLPVSSEVCVGTVR